MGIAGSVSNRIDVSYGSGILTGKTQNSANALPGSGGWESSHAT